MEPLWPTKKPVTRGWVIQDDNFGFYLYHTEPPYPSTAWTGPECAQRFATREAARKVVKTLKSFDKGAPLRVARTDDL